MLDQVLLAFRLAAAERGWRTVLLFHIFLVAVLVLITRATDEYGFANGYENIVMVLALPFAAGDVFDRERRTGRAQVLTTLGLRAEALASGVLFFRILVFVAGCMAVGLFHQVLFTGVGIPNREILTIIIWLPFQYAGLVLLAALLSIYMPGWSNILGLVAYAFIVSMMVAGVNTLSMGRHALKWVILTFFPGYFFIQLKPGGVVTIDIDPGHVAFYIFQLLLFFLLTLVAFRRSFLSPPRMPRLFRRSRHR